MGSWPHTPGWLAPRPGHLGPRASPKSHCPLDLGRRADCEVPLRVGGWSLAALWILQAPPQPALSLQPPQLQAGQDSGFPSVLWICAPSRQQACCLWTPFLLHHSQCSFPGSPDEADPSISFCLPSARCRFLFWVVGGPTVGPGRARGPGHVPARAGGGPGAAGGLVGVDPAVNPGCPQHAGQLLPRERLKGVKAGGSPFLSVSLSHLEMHKSWESYSLN